MDPKWKKATIYKKENDSEDEEDEEEAVVYLQRSTRQKKLDVNFTFADQVRIGGDIFYMKPLISLSLNYISRLFL